MFEITKDQFDRTVKMLRKIAKENGKVEFFSGTFYFFGSELATLRLLKKYRDCDNANQGYSDNLGAFFFSLETQRFYGEMSTE